MMFRIAVAALAAAALGTTVALAQSTSTPPVITVASKGKTVAVSGTPQSGAVTFLYTHDKSKEADPEIFRLKDGVTQDQFEAALAKLGPDPTPILKLGDLVSGAFLGPGQPSGRLTTVLTPGNYVALNTAGTKPASFPRVAFTVTAADQPATRPAPTVTYTMRDFRFSGPARIKKSGTLRFDNKGKSPHFVVALKPPKGFPATKLAALLKAGKDSKAPKATQFRSLLGLVSPGSSNDLKYSLSPGKWVIACFMQTASSKGKEHSMLGMEKVVTVR